MIQYASDSDLNQIIEIQHQNLFDFSQIKNQAYLSDAKKNGFNVFPITLPEIELDKDKILLVNKDQDKVLGFIWISLVTENHNYLWFGPKIKSRLHSQRIYKIKGFSVLKNNLNQGLENELLESCYKYLKDESIKFLVSPVAFNPIVNLAAINFYENENFIKAAVSLPIPYLSFGNYQCLLYSKKL